jgi:hypothetical protein
MRERGSKILVETGAIEVADAALAVGYVELRTRRAARRRAT